MYTNIGDYDYLEKMADMVILNCKHDFTEDELQQESQMLAQSVSDKATEENNKKVAMTSFKNKIDTHEGAIKLHASNINHGFTYIDKASVMYRDYVTSKRVYFDKSNGDFLKEEAFHHSDYQKKIDFELEATAREEQIAENNTAGDFANGLDALDEVIIDKKVAKGKKGKPTPKDNLPENYNKFAEVQDDLGLDEHGNPTDIYQK